MSKCRALKLFAVVLGVALLAFALCSCGQQADKPDASLDVSSNEPSADFSQVESSMEPTATSTPEPTSEPTPEPTPEPVIDLPVLEDVSWETQPLMYDFLNSCLDWHVPIHRDEFESDFYIMRNVTAPNFLHTDWYVVQAGFTVPPSGSEIVRVEIEEEKLPALEAAIAALPEERRIVEGDWELLLLNSYSEDGIDGFGEDDMWGGLYSENFAVLQLYTDGNPLPFLKDGSGWPTEWLRREPYCSLLREEEGIDIKDPWWDTWNYRGEYPMEDPSGDYDFGHSYVICTGYETFSMVIDGTDRVDGMTWDDVRNDCNGIGYNISGKYEAGSWDPWE